jgi:hypothetical protein
MAMPAINSRCKLGPLSSLGLTTPATMLNSLKLYVGSLTHEAKRKPLRFRDLMGTRAVFSAALGLRLQARNPA